jgi:hypothetical protein
MEAQTVETEFWTFKKYGPRNFSARATAKNDLCRHELRFYYSEDAFSQDFGRVDFAAAKEKP